MVETRNRTWTTGFKIVWRLYRVTTVPLAAKDNVTLKETSAPASSGRFLPSPTYFSWKQKEGPIVIQRPLSPKYVLRLPELMVSFAVAQYQEMSSILDCPRKSFVLFFVFLKKILVEGKKKKSF